MDTTNFPILFVSLLSSISFATYLLISFLSHREPAGKGDSSVASLVPPGKMGLPFLGESIEFVLGMLKGRPEKFIHNRIRRYSSDTFKTSLMGDPITVMHGAAGNKFLFSNEGKLVKAWWPKPVHRLIPSSNAETFRVKDIAHPLLKPDGLKKHIGTMDRMAKLHFEAKWLGRQQVNVHPLAEDYAFSLGCQLFMSINDMETIESLVTPMAPLRRGILSIPIDLPWTQFGKAMRASRLVMERLKVIIRKRRTEIQFLLDDDSSSTSVDLNDDHDMMSLLLFATNELGERMNDHEIADRLMGFLVAGHDTSSAVTSLIFSFLADHPDVYDKVLQEQMEVAASKAQGELLNWEDMRKMRYSWNVAREVMRLYPPALAIHREAMDDFTYDGYCIPRGWKVQLNISAIHRDPRFFPQPEKFDPSRFEGAGPQPYTYVPFGGGQRMCPGRNYAQMEILIFVHNIITKFRWEKVHANEAVLFNPLPKPVHGLPVRLRPHAFLRAKYDA